VAAHSTAVSSPAAKPVSLARQFGTCALFCALAIVIIAAFHDRPYANLLLQGHAVAVQLAFVVCLGALYFAGASIGYRRMARQRSAKHIVDSYSRLDLTGLNPLWIAVAAGVGEELLFRGALQPLLGIWVTSLLFVAAHARAYRFDGLSRRVALQAFALFAASCFFGLVAEYVGLLAAIGGHIAVDAVGLYFVKRAATPPGAALLERPPSTD
jgi:membrane protease YdiL (CAAX protease family)